jgi:hypothetical protein
MMYCLFWLHLHLQQLTQLAHGRSLLTALIGLLMHACPHTNRSSVWNVARALTLIAQCCSEAQSMHPTHHPGPATFQINLLDALYLTAEKRTCLLIPADSHHNNSTVDGTKKHNRLKLDAPDYDSCEL